MVKTATYCSDCYNKAGRTEDPDIKAAEATGNAPMTAQGTCCKCNKATIVVFYEK